MSSTQKLLFLITILYIFTLLYSVFTIFITNGDYKKNILLTEQPICVVKFNERYILLNKNTIIFKISDIPIIGYPIVNINDYYKYKNEIAKLSLNELNYISKIDFKNKTLYINPNYIVFFNSWNNVVDFFENIINELKTNEPGKYILLSGGNLISAY
ncbi:DUF4894 domain-containing protein [Marinitoga sp. 38H-ov]|uniref:DUF4894 domain-containing protein n=1 Tax=Marinitoga sp. 38H-ov TaxID=1755814 RepID=UPI0013ECC805|nr:DUF4894 domain-containing protein [Marinitoga sp. 38H-ov]KAF2956383.1 hypothetical protein AS160_06670 [Marinitoga sp. 38H-ov]